MHESAGCPWQVTAPISDVEHNRESRERPAGADTVLSLSIETHTAEAQENGLLFLVKIANCSDLVTCSAVLCRKL